MQRSDIEVTGDVRNLVEVQLVVYCIHTNLGNLTRARKRSEATSELEDVINNPLHHYHA
jgi:hypothetical protein